MKQNLIVVDSFVEYKIGGVIEGPEQIKKILASSNATKSAMQSLATTQTLKKSKSATSGVILDFQRKAIATPSTAVHARLFIRGES